MEAKSFSRKALLTGFEDGSTAWALLTFAMDVLLFVLGNLIVIFASAWALKFVGTLVVTAAIVRLFLIGHDACHGSFFKNDRLNNLVGRMAFVPSLTAFSLWDVGHNVAHHGFNNLKGRDQVWAPFSKAEFDQLSPSRRVLEKIYRSGYGCGAYYLIELWWKKLYFATRKQIGSSRVKYKIDSAIVTVGGLLWVATLFAAAERAHQSFALVWTLAMLVPFMLWNCIMGFVVYVQHTHPEIPWFSKRQEWQHSRGYLTATANVRLPWRVDLLMHGIMEHNAHHVNPRIPMFNLRSAQDVLRERTEAPLRSYQLDKANYADCVRRCKLYDFERHVWLDFAGAPTSRSLISTALV